MKKPDKPKRELATKNIRIYPSTLERLQEQSVRSGKSIARLISDFSYKAEIEEMTVTED